MGFRILHVIATVNPAGGGPIEGLSQLAKVNSAHGHVVEVASLDDPAAPWVKNCPITCHALGPSWLKYRYSRRLVPWLRDHRRDYDAVIVNGIWQYGSFGTWRALHNTPTRYFVFTHGMLDPWFKRRYPLKHLKKWLYWPWSEYRVLRDAAAVMFTCEDERRLARQTFWLYKCDEFVVNYGTAAPPGNAAEQRQVFEAAFPEIIGRRNLLFLSRVHEKKGVDLLLRAFERVLRTRPESETRNLHLIIAGPSADSYGEQMRELGRQLGIDSQITWTGMLRGDLKWGAFRCAEAFVLPSHQENFGIAVAESLACGVPVLISNQVNIWREIEQANGGYVETDDLAGTELLIRRWLATEPERWERMRHDAIECFDKRFYIERTAESFIKAMEIYGLKTLDRNGDPVLVKHAAP